MDLAAWVTAIGTAALAIATFVYVRLTRSATDAAQRSAAAAEASAIHAARAIDATERSMLAQSMPLLIAVYSSWRSGPGTLEFAVRNVGKSTAVNVVLMYDDERQQVQAIGASEQERAVHAMTANMVDGIVTPSTPVTLEYEDGIGNRLRTVSTLVASEDMSMHVTSLWSAGGWKPMGAAS